MAEAIKVFISYRNVTLSRFIGGTLDEKLRAQGFDVFFDQTRLKSDGGVPWEQVLETNVRNSHVLLVLIEPETGQSFWVKREIETAREVFAAVVPIVINEEDEKQDSIKQVLVDLKLDSLQFLSYSTQAEAIIETIKTRSEEVIERRNRELAWQQEKTGLFRLKGAEDVCLVELLTGDATDIAGYDVLVNTENTYMQMARYFESNTLSCTIRRKGSLIRGGFTIEDTVQDQLNRQVFFSPDYPGTPVRTLEVIVTEAGHPESELALKDFRYIFHAATVTVDPWSQRIDALPLQAIPEVVSTCMKKVDQVDQLHGSVLYIAENQLEDQQPDYVPIGSIIFPVFGAGQGGHKVEEVTEKIIQGIKTYINRHVTHGGAVPKIGLCVYNPDHAEVIAKQFTAQGFTRVKN